ncbi:MAG: histone deacetylase [Saprospiraceae bacterium]|nr:histone deacetylase [Saprospiraceae bacterium]MDW8229096.1 histone deacetylase [Saprospiraceae bacterium]
MLKIAYSPVYVYPLPEGHRFPMAKYEVIAEQLLYEGTVREDNFFHPDMLSQETALLVHTEEYWHKLNTVTLTEREERAIGFPITERFVVRGRHISQGTIQCALFAQQYGVAMNIAGGTHHAYADHGEGYCCFNDQAIAAAYLLQQGLSRQILIVDLDVHQGNGTAHIFRNEPRVFTFSMHGARNYPLRKERSDLDLPLPDGLEDEPYLTLLRETLPRLFDEVQPDFVFYQSGVDILETDRLGRLRISRNGCRERDRFVLRLCRQHRVPVAVSMGGGYSPRLSDIVEAHANTFRTAQEVFF